MSRTLAHVSGTALRIPESVLSLADAQSQKGRQFLCREQYRRARKHFRAALRIDPDNAAARFGLARAWEVDPYGSDDRACKHFRMAVKREPSALHLAHLGRSAARVGRGKLARRSLFRAVCKAPADAAVLEVVLESLREAGRLSAAWNVACQARFRAPRDRAIQRLWERVQYDRAARRETKKTCKSREVVPFLRLVTEEEPASILRFDKASVLRPHV